MNKDERIEFKVSVTEKEQIKETAKNSDCDSVSAYLLALHRAHKRKLENRKK